MDLGTEFAMRVDAGGTGEVHVLDGEVSLRRGRGEEDRLLKHGEAIRYSESGELSRFKYDGESFVDATRLRELDRSSCAAGRKQWSAQSERWANDPAILLYYNFENQQDTDRRLRMRSPWHPRHPKERSSAAAGRKEDLEGKKALEFKRTSDRVRVDLQGQFQSLSLVMWLRIEGLDSVVQLPPSFRWIRPGESPHWQLTREGRLKFSVSGGGSYPSAPIFKPSDLGRWVQLATVYDHEARKVYHY